MKIRLPRPLLAALPLLLAPLVHADADDELFVAVMQGDDAAVAATLEQGAAADAVGRDQVSALMLAAERGHTPIVRRLLAAGANAHATREGGITVLMHAAASGKLDTLRLLLEAKADVNARASRNGITALRVAVATGSVDCARALLEAGADRDELDSRGGRLLFTAAGTGLVELIDLLLVAGEDINHARREDGLTALDAALEQRRWRAAEHLMARGATLAASSIGVGNALRKLLELEPVVSPGTMTLVQTVELPSVALFRTVLAQGADTGFIDEKGNNLLLLAARRHHVTALEALLAAGLDANARNAEGDTALSIAAGKSEYELMAIGIGLALAQDREQLLRLMFRPAQRSNESSATARRLEAARLLLAARIDPNSIDENGDSALIEATRSGDVELVSLLLAAGARADVRNKEGHTPLLLAAQFGLDDIAGTLLAARADTQVRDAEGRTALELARAGGHAKVVRRLESAARM